MFIPHEGPGTWQSFLKRKDNVGLAIMEARQKYLKEQLLFESYINTLNTVNTVSTAAAGAAGGPAPSTGGGGDNYDDWDVVFKVNTNYNVTTTYYDIANPTTRVNMNFSVNNGAKFAWPGGSSFPWGKDVEIDWGDGTVETKSAYDTLWYSVLGVVQHDYASDGEYIIKMRGTAAYHIKWMFVPVVAFLKYDPALIEDYRMLFSYTIAAAQQNFETDISNWVIPAGAVLESLCNHNGFNDNIQAPNRSDYAVLWDFSNWDVSNVTNFTRAFWTAPNFNASSISGWSPSPTNSVAMFRGIDSSYGSDISTLDLTNWDFSQNEAFDFMFWESNYGMLGIGTLEFYPSQPTRNGFLKDTINPISSDIANWSLASGATGIPMPDNLSAQFNWMGNIFNISKADFGTALIGWAAEPTFNFPINFNVTGITSGLTDYDYSGDPAVSAALTTLQNTYGWTLTGFTF